MTKIIKDPNEPPAEDLLFLSDDPSTIAAHLKQRKVITDTADAKPADRYDFADFVTEMNMTDFNDAYQIRATLESQAQLLGTAFQYLMMDGDWKNLQHILRTQKVMRDTMELMNQYPPLTDFKQGLGEPDASMD